MNEIIDPFIKTIREKTKRRGEILRFSLKSIAEEGHFSLSDLAEKGVISADVEYGQEAYAFLPYKPRFLFLGETLEISPKREKEISDALAVLHSSTVHIERYRPIEFLRQVYTQGVRGAGMITWLNIFPDYLEYDNGGTLGSFAKEAEKLLCPGGRVIMSFVHFMEDKRDQLRQCGIVMKEGIPGLRLSLLSNHRLNAAGKLVLMGEKI